MMRLLLAVLCVGFLALPSYAADIEDNVAKLKLSKEELLKLGEAIYNTDEANTCLRCHGKGGHGGDQAGAADLRHPRTWRVYQALGGDAALAANKEKFLQDIDVALHYLIRHGATTWNLRFEKAHKDIKYDWSKVSIPDKADKYNNMMKGLTSEPMKKPVKELIQEKMKLTPAQAQDLAAVADFEYVKTFDDGSDKGGVFK
ncbi:MAG TPA: hypothetical protein VIH59_15635 [Candidatus Tectomicrobia bacterium]